MTLFPGEGRTPEIATASWFLLVITVLAVSIRLWTKIWMFRKLHKDDYIILLSAVRSAKSTIKTPWLTLLPSSYLILARSYVCP